VRRAIRPVDRTLGQAAAVAALALAFSATPACVDTVPEAPGANEEIDERSPRGGRGQAEDETPPRRPNPRADAPTDPDAGSLDGDAERDAASDDNATDDGGSFVFPPPPTDDDGEGADAGTSPDPTDDGDPGEGDPGEGDPRDDGLVAGPFELVTLEVPFAGVGEAEAALEAGTFVMALPNETCTASSGDDVYAQAFLVTNSTVASEIEVEALTFAQSSRYSLPGAEIFRFDPGILPGNPAGCVERGGLDARGDLRLEPFALGTGESTVIVVTGRSATDAGTFALLVERGSDAGTDPDTPPDLGDAPFATIDVVLSPGGSSTHSATLGGPMPDGTPAQSWARPSETCTSGVATRPVVPFRLINPVDGDIVVTNAVSSGFDSYLHAYRSTATSLGDLSACIAGNDDGPGFTVDALLSGVSVPGRGSVYIMVSAFGAGTGPFSLNIQASSEGAEVLCSNTCVHAYDFDCDDGGPGSDFGICELGTDCADCGPRYR